MHDATSNPSFYYLILILVLALSSLGMMSRGRGSEVWRAARWWVGIFAVAILAAAFWPDVRPRLMSIVDPAGGHSDGEQIIFRKGNDGHFYARLSINGRPTTFIVDTGASDLALTKVDAAAAGINMDTLVFDEISQTANGLSRGARVRLTSVALSGREFRNVSASVMGGDIDISLLGMSFLSRFGKLTIEGDRMILTQ
jgi:aspartyl protease family protein